MTNPRVSDAVELQVRIEARPETVFAFFTDPVKALRWMGISAELDPRPGGIYRVNVTGQDIALGRYLEVVPHSRVVFTWGWESGRFPVPPGASTVEVTLVADGEGTLVRLRHHGLTGDLAVEHTLGWEHYLERLAVAAAGRDPGVDPRINPEPNGG